MNLNEIEQGLKNQGYLADENTSMVINYALMLDKPLLVEGPAGAGKTGLAKAFSQYLNRDLIRLQCYEGIDESKSLYEWNYQKQLLYMQSKELNSVQWLEAGKTIYTKEFLLERPLLKAIRSSEPTVLLIDEIDKSDEEFESLLLEILSEWQISIPEIGTISAVSIPFVILTSNNTRNLSQALRRRCLYLYLDYPDEQRELDILRIHFPGLNEHLGRQAITFIRKIRLEKLRKHPSISEVIDWVNILGQSGTEELTPDVAAHTLNILLKYQEDYKHVREKLNQRDWYDGIFHL